MKSFFSKDVVRIITYLILQPIAFGVTFVITALSVGIAWQIGLSHEVTFIIFYSLIQIPISIWLFDLIKPLPKVLSDVWYGIVSTLTIIIVIYFGGVLIERYPHAPLVFHKNSLMTLYFCALILLPLISPTRQKHWIGQAVVAFFAIYLGIISITHYVPFNLDNGIATTCEGVEYRAQKYFDIKGYHSYNYYQTTRFDWIVANPDWDSISYECQKQLGQGTPRFHDEVFVDEYESTEPRVQVESLSVTFVRPISYEDFLTLNEFIEVGFQDDVATNIIALTDTGQEERIIYPKTPEELKQNLGDNKIKGIESRYQVQEYDDSDYLELIDFRRTGGFRKEPTLDVDAFRTNLASYDYTGTSVLDDKEEVYREVIFKPDTLYYEDFRKIDSFLGSIFEQNQFNDFYYEVSVDVDPSQEIIPAKVIGGAGAYSTPEEFISQYQQVGLRYALQDRGLGEPSSKQQDIYQNPIHKYILFPHPEQQIDERFDYLFGIRDNFSNTQRESWNQELQNLNLSRERIQSIVQTTQTN